MEEKKNKTVSASSKRNKAAWNKMSNSRKIDIKMSVSEQTLLEKIMSDLGTTNKSRAIKYKLFGLRPDEKMERKIEEGDRELMGIALKNELRDLVNVGQYFKERYNSDLEYVWHKENKSYEELSKKTNRWFAVFTVRLERTIELCLLIINSLGLDRFIKDETTQGVTQDELDNMTYEQQQEYVRNLLGGNPFD